MLAGLAYLGPKTQSQRKEAATHLDVRFMANAALARWVTLPGLARVLCISRRWTLKALPSAARPLPRRDPTGEPMRLIEREGDAVRRS